MNCKRFVRGQRDRQKLRERTRGDGWKKERKNYNNNKRRRRMFINTFSRSLPSYTPTIRFGVPAENNIETQSIYSSELN